MTLSKAITYLKKNEKATVESQTARAYQQTLKTLEKWIFDEKNLDDHINFLRAKDWKVENVTKN